MTDKVVIGLTGNIATGKSLVLRMLQELGATGIDADKLVHQLMRQIDSPVYRAVVEEFGKFILDDEGQINRRKLGKIAFSIPEALERLEVITHPAVRQEIMRRVEQAETPVVVIEAIKLFESGLADQCQANWVVTAPPEIQLRRLVERRKMTPDQAQQRIKAQSPSREKEVKATLVIHNGGELAKTWAFVKKQYSAFLEDQTGVDESVPSEPAPSTSTPRAGETAAPEALNVEDVTIRRAKRSDLEAMARLVSQATQGTVAPDMSEMMEALFSRAYLVAIIDDYVVGIAGWQTENLIAGLQDFYVLRDDMWPTVGQKMLERIHEEVDNLSCEVAMTFVLNAAGSKPVEFFESQDYEQAEGKDLGYMWKDAAVEWQPEDSVLLYKKLREQRIMVPM